MGAFTLRRPSPRLTSPARSPPADIAQAVILRRMTYTVRERSMLRTMAIWPEW